MIIPSCLFSKISPKNINNLFNKRTCISLGLFPISVDKWTFKHSLACIRKFFESDDEIRVMRNVWDVVCWECGMLGLCDVRDVGCSRCGMFGTWDVGDVRCWRCGMFGMWDVWDIRDVGCLGCEIFGMWDVREVGCGMWDVFRHVRCLFTKFWKKWNEILGQVYGFDLATAQNYFVNWISFCYLCNFCHCLIFTLFFLFK